MVGTRPFLNVNFNNVNLLALYDTGAAPNLLSLSSFNRIKAAGAIVKKLPASAPIVTADGHPAPVVGKFQLTATILGRQYSGPFIVLPQLSSEMILGMKAISELTLRFDPQSRLFSFADGLGADAIELLSAERRSILPGKSALVNFSTNLDGQPAYNQTIVATVAMQNVAVETDDRGQFKLRISNPNSVPIEYSRRQHVGGATLFSNFETVGQGLSDVAAAEVSAVAQGRGTASPKLPPAILAPMLKATEHLQPQARAAILRALARNGAAISRSKYDLGLCDILKHKITLTDPTPVYHKQFPVPLAHLDIIREQVQQWQKLGIVEPARSPYNSPIFCVKKKGDGGMRLCLDYRAVNAKSLPENYTIRTPEDCLAEVGQAGGRFFIALDLSSGFYQMELDPKSRPITAFSVPGMGQLQWTRGAMGLKGCPGSFARLMDMALRGVKNAITYIDDVLIFGKTEQHAIETLGEVLGRLAKHHLKVNLSKSTFLLPSTEYLGHTLTASGIHPGKDKTEAILSAQPPVSIKQLKSFLGCVNYFRHYIPHFAHKASKLYALTRGDSPWRGGTLPPESLRTFQVVKEAIAKAVPRSFPYATGKFHLFVDGAMGDSKEEGGLGAHLMQEGPKGDLHSIGFASRQLKKHEKNYSAFLLELAAAVEGIDYFHQYLKGRSFTLYTDHAPLTKLSTVHTKTLHRLHALLNEHSFDMKHIPGKQNPVADFLSRSHGPTQVDAVNTTPHRIAVLQAKDEILGPVLAALERGAAPADLPLPGNLRKYRERLRLQQGVLVIQLPSRPGFPEDDKPRALVPHTLRNSLLQEAHNSALGGHQGIFRTATPFTLTSPHPPSSPTARATQSGCSALCQGTQTGSLPPNGTPPLS